MSLSTTEPSSTGPDGSSATGAAGGDREPPGGQGPARARRHGDLPIHVVNGNIRMGRRLKDLWTHRELLVLLTRSQLKMKYKDSILGYVWSMLNPMLVLSIYYVIFKYISKNPTPDFAIWLFAGLLVWNLFNNAAMTATTVVVGNAGIVKKVAFPRELLAIATVGVALVLFLIQVGVLIVALAAFQHTPAYLYMTLLPFAMIDLIIFTSAVCIFLSAVNVYLRDTQHLTEVLLMAWFWSVPIVYEWSTVGPKFAKHGLTWLKYLYVMDPITPIAMTFQRAIYGNGYVLNGVHTTLLPDIGFIGYGLALTAVLVASVALFLLALVVFGRLEGNFAEEL
ncbi:MAG: ABC transporter permease [Actinomycetota bacterium]|nr:ABC transporter permease [Actinomycetota bacterium]